MTGDFQPQKAQLIMTLRGMGILDSRVLAALESVPRELFVPPALRHHSYENSSLPIAFEGVNWFLKSDVAVAISQRSCRIYAGASIRWSAFVHCLSMLKTGFATFAYRISAFVLVMGQRVGPKRRHLTGSF